VAVAAAVGERAAPLVLVVLAAVALDLVVVSLRQAP
jgi:hypothetical protein